MKKIFAVAVALMGCMVAMGQEADIELTADGGYEKKVVVEVDSTSAGVLFGRAMEALSDWSDGGSSKVELSYQDKDSGTVIYKGMFFLGSHVIQLKNVNRYAEFSVKVRCKDGRAQVACTVSGFKLIVENGQVQSFTVGDLLSKVAGLGKKKQERWDGVISDMKSKTDKLVETVSSRIKDGPDDF